MAQKQPDPILRYPPIIVRDAPKLDLETYIANYEGVTRLHRLATIGASSQFLGLEAMRLAVAEAKQGKNVNAYAELVERLYAWAPADAFADMDQEWVESRSRQIKAETDRLEHELKGYKNNLIKESIRMGNEDLGAFYYETGDYANAFKAYSRMREYCTTPKHIFEMSLKLILTAIAQDNWMQVQSNVYKIAGLQLKPEDKARADPLLAPLRGLVSLASGAYRDAASAFLSTDPAWLTLDPVAGIRFNRQVVSANDIAAYGALCALASMTRAELTAAVLDNAEFRNFLELEPHVRRAVACFCGAKYTQCLEVLAAYKGDYECDVYLARHVEPLYTAIRRKSVVAYFAPFSRVKLADMAEAFSIPEAVMRAELIELIDAGVLEARLDLVEGLVVATSEERRAVVHARALEAAAEHERQLRLRLFRINMLEAGLEVKAPIKDAEGKGFGAGFGKAVKAVGGGAGGGRSRYEM